MVNEDSSVKVIRELQAEVSRLRKLLEEAKQVLLKPNNIICMMMVFIQLMYKYICLFTNPAGFLWGVVVLCEGGGRAASE